VTLELNWDVTGKVEYDDTTYTDIVADSDMAAYIKKQLTPFIGISSDEAKRINANGKGEKVKPVKGLRNIVEKGCANGQLLILVAMRSRNRVLIKVFENDAYYPISDDEDGILNDVVTRTEIIRNGFIYTLLSRYTYDAEARVFSWEHKAYRRKKSEAATIDDFGDAVALSEVREWESLNTGADGREFTGIQNIDRAIFTEFKMPQNNYMESGSRTGIPLFSKALDMFRNADQQGRQKEREYRTKEVAIFAPPNMWKDIGPKSAKDPRKGRVVLAIPEGDEREYVQTDIDMDKPYVFDPPFRDEALRNGYNDIMRQIEDVCEVARGTISDVDLFAKTATEVEASKDESKTTEGDIQEAWGITLREVAAIIHDLAVAYRIHKPDEYEITINWGDGIPQDDTVTFSQSMAMEARGLLSKSEARARIDKISLDYAQYRVSQIKEEGDEYG